MHIRNIGPCQTPICLFSDPYLPILRLLFAYSQTPICQHVILAVPDYKLPPLPGCLGAIYQITTVQAKGEKGGDDREET